MENIAKFSQIIYISCKYTCMKHTIFLLTFKHNLLYSSLPSYKIHETIVAVIVR